MRGFIISLISVSLMAVLFTLASSLHDNYLALERAISDPQPLLYAANVFDKASLGLNSLLGPSISFRQTNSTFGVTIYDTLPKVNYTSKLSNYKSFLESTLANETESNISADFSNLSSAVRVFINNYTYTNNGSSGEILFTRTGGTGATNYELNMTAFGTEANITHFNFNSSGNLNVTLRYSDYNGTSVESGTLSSGATNSFSIDYGNGTSLNITIGLKGGNGGSLWIKSNGVNASASFFASLPKLNETDSPSYAYDAMMNYTQGRAGKFTRLGKQ